MMKKVSVSDEYNVVISSGILDRAGAMIRVVEKGSRCVVVADDNTAPLYSEKVLDSLSREGVDASLCVIPHGESNKHIGTVTDILNFLAERRLARNDFVVALGGGVVGDLAGFAAAIYLRGISFVQIPTTLLAQIDSSVGGKTGCDLPSGKNLAGAFHKPSLVIIDTDTLKTLECVKIKADIVTRDFKESGERTLLNFGHTVGHAIEKTENFSGLSHGAAVAVGMCAITRAAEKVDLCHKGNADRIAALCRKYGLPTDRDITPMQVQDAASLDKKRMGAQIKLVLIRKIGDSYVCPIKVSRLHELLEGCIGVGL